MSSLQLKVYEILKIRLGEKEAEMMIEYMGEKTETKFQEKQNMLASKEDLLHVKEGLTKDLFSVKEELMEKINGEISSVRKEIAESKADTIKWMFIFWVGQLAAMIAMLKLIH